jgi:type II secretion system protein G
VRKGFTLIELMIVIAIIIILSSIAIPNYLRMTERAKISAIESDLKSIATALEAFSTDWTQYPNVQTWKDLKNELTGQGSLNSSSKTTITGEAGGIVYIRPEALGAIEIKAGGADNIKYTSTGGDYKLEVTTTIGAKTYKFTMTPGGQIAVSATSQ